MGQWTMEPDLGREYDSLRACFTAEAGSGVEDAPAAVYRLWFRSTGRFPLEIYRLPTLNEMGQQRIGISVDNQAPVFLEGSASAGTARWAEGVLSNCEILSAEIDIGAPGPHTLRLYGVDPGVMVEKLVIYTGQKPRSYFGPPANFR